MMASFFWFLQGDKKRRKRKENKPGKQVKEVTRKRYAGVDKEFISEEAAHHQQTTTGGYVADPLPVDSSPAAQPKHATVNSYVQGWYFNL